MVKVNRIPKPYVGDTASIDAQKRLEDLVKDNLLGVGDGKTVIQESPVGFRSPQGEVIRYAGINYLVGVCLSPLTPEGSGQGHSHPDTKRIISTITVERVDIPVPAGTTETLTIEEYIKSRVVAIKAESLVSLGTPLVSIKSAQDKVLPILRWESVLPGRVKDIEVIHSEITNNLQIKISVEQLRISDVEKFRGFSKYRSDGGFDRSIKIQESGTGKLVFNPNIPLKDEEGNYLQLERVISTEESKTILFVVGLVAHELGEPGAIWDSLTGQWENFETIVSKMEEMMLKVDVSRWDIDPEIYSGFKNLYGDDPKFIFDDDTRSIVHKEVPFWQGVQTEVVETPTTLAFAGKTSLFLEHILYLGSEYPVLFQKFLDSMRRNKANIVELYSGMGLFYDCLNSFEEWEYKKSLNDPEYPAVLQLPPSFDKYQRESLILTENSKITWREDFDKERMLVVFPDGGEEYRSNALHELMLSDSLDWDSALTILERKLSKKDIKGLLFFSSRSTSPSLLFIPLKSFIQYTRNGNSLTYRDFISLLMLLETPLDKRDEGWNGLFYRSIQIVKGRLEKLIAESNSMAAKMSKTEKICLSARIGTTNWGIIRPNEIHLHPASVAYYGLHSHYSVHLDPLKDPANDNVSYHWKVDGKISKENPSTYGDTVGDYLIFGRIPVPGMDLLKVISNELVPFGTVFTLSSTHQFANEGDADGDSVTCPVVRGDELFECKGIAINPLDDNVLS